MDTLRKELVKVNAERRNKNIVTLGDIVKAWIINKNSASYNAWRKFRIPKKEKGKEREIIIPVHPALLLAQDALADIFKKIPMSDYTFAYKKEGGPVQAAWHIAKSNPGFIWAIDLKDFFPSIKFDMIAEALQRHGWDYKSAIAAADISTYKYSKKITENGKEKVITYPATMVQGTKTSPPLSNIVSSPMHDELAELAHKYGLGYMAYSDNLYFYGPIEKNDLWDEMKGQIKEIIKKHRFMINYKKTRRMTGMMRVLSMEIKDGKVYADRKLISLVRAMIHRVARGEKAFLNGEEVGPAQVLGKISWIWSINKQFAKNIFSRYVIRLKEKFGDEVINERLREYFPKEIRETFLTDSSDSVAADISDLFGG